MDGVSAASGIAGLITLALQVGGTIALYISAIKERSKNVQELHDELLLLGEILSNLRDFLESDKAQGRSFDKNSVLDKAIGDCRDRIERIGERLKPPEGGKFARAIDKLKWPFEERDVKQMTENLQRFGQTFHFAVTIEGCNLLSKNSEDATKGLQEMLEVSRKISDLSAQMGLSTAEASKRAGQLEQIIALVPMLTKTAVDVREISQAARLAELREQERRATDILNWLAPISSLHKHGDLQLKRAEGTGTWFLEHEDFVRWKEEKTGHQDLLCIGGPGAGKSMLCSLVVDHLRTIFKNREVGVAYYYYDYSEQQSQSPANLAGAILRQLCSSAETVPFAVAEFYQRTRNDVKDQTWFHDLLSILGRVVATYACCFIMVDALDEADLHSQRSALFEVLDALRTSAGTDVKVLVTLRPHVLSIAGRFRRPVTIDILANPQDLRRFLTQAIDDHPDSDSIMDPALKERVIDRVSETANGMFLLPALQIRTVLDQITKADVKRALQQLSTNLTEAFQSTVQRIFHLPETRRDLAFRTLMWVSHARRPLGVSELQHALALRFAESDIDRDNIPSVRTLVDCCCGLVEVDQQSSIVRLVHHSLEEYLRDQDHGLFQDANLAITRTCLKYLMLDSMKSLPFNNRSHFASAVEEMPFSEYAALEWGHHAYDLPAADIKDLAIPLLSDSVSLITMARVRDFRSADFRKWKDKAWAWASSSGAGISLAAAFGLTELLELLIDANKGNLRLDARNLYGSTPLHEAALHGHENAAELLLRHGADLLDRNYGSSTPLYLAVSYGRLSMVRLLLGYGRAQLDCPGPKGYTALHKAVEQGNEEMVVMLLQAGALVASHDHQGMTPLHLAARRGHLSITRLFVAAGAFVHVKDKDGLCPLDYAATGGYTEVVALLLENGGSMWHKGREAWTPLHRAARGGHTETVSFFLERGADVLAADFKGNIPLHLAVRSGSMATTKKLLEYDVSWGPKQLFSRDKKGSTPRVVAFFTAHYDVHKYLRAAEWEVLGTDPTSNNGGGGANANALTQSIERGDLEGVRAHLDRHPEDMDKPDEDGQPPLHVALQEQQKDIARFLLGRGASVETPGYHGWRPLHIAASLGSLELVELCLGHGAGVGARSHTRQTPLHKAASSRSVPTLDRLLEAGADPADANDRGMTALHVAAHQNDVDMVRRLLRQADVDVLARDRLGLTPAMWAERSNHLPVLAVLRVEMKGAKLAARKGGPAAGRSPAGSPAAAVTRSVSRGAGRQSAGAREQQTEAITKAPASAPASAPATQTTTLTPRPAPTARGRRSPRPLVEGEDLARRPQVGHDARPVDACRDVDVDSDWDVEDVDEPPSSVSLTPAVSSPTHAWL